MKRTRCNHLETHVFWYGCSKLALQGFCYVQECPLEQIDDPSEILISELGHSPAAAACRYPENGRTDPVRLQPQTLTPPSPPLPAAHSPGGRELASRSCFPDRERVLSFGGTISTSQNLASRQPGEYGFYATSLCGEGRPSRAGAGGMGDETSVVLTTPCW